MSNTTKAHARAAAMITSLALISVALTGVGTAHAIGPGAQPGFRFPVKDPCIKAYVLNLPAGIWCSLTRR